MRRARAHRQAVWQQSSARTGTGGIAQWPRARGSAGRARDGDGPMPDIAFHGFISNEAGEPLPDMTVRVASPRLRTQLAASVAMGN